MEVVIAMQYYFPQPNLTQIVDIPGYANYYAAGLLMPLLLLAWFVVLFSWFSKYDRFTALAGAIGGTLLTALPLSFITFNSEGGNSSTISKQLESTRLLCPLSGHHEFLNRIGKC